MKLCVPISLAILAAAPLCGADLASLLVPVAQMKAEAKAPDANTEKSANEAAQAVKEKPAPAIYASGQEILSALADALTERFSAEGKLTLDTPQALRPIKVKDSAWRVEIIRVSGNSLAKRTTVAFRVVCGEETQAEYQLGLTCALQREVLVADRRMDSKSQIGGGDFDIQVRDVLDVSVGTPVPAKQDLGDYELKGTVASGDILLWRDITLKPTLRKGQVVEAVADEGFMHVSVKAMALEDGRKGEVISIRNLSSNKEIQARILNDRKVQVYF